MRVLGSTDTPFDECEFTPIKKQNSVMNRLRNRGVAPRRDLSVSRSRVVPSFGDMLVEDHNNAVSEQVDWSMWSVFG